MNVQERTQISNTAFRGCVVEGCVESCGANMLDAVCFWQKEPHTLQRVHAFLNVRRPATPQTHCQVGGG